MTRRVAGSAAAVAAATLLVYALESIAPVLSLGVLYTLPVLAAAVLWGLVDAIVVAVASMLAFNFLFLPPVHTLTLADGRNWAALAVYVATAVVVSQLAARARRRAAEAEQREREAALLADAAAALLQDESLDDVRSRADDVLAGADDAARARFDAAMASLVSVADERREAEAVRRSDALKTVILHTVSHDLRTPIATLQAALGALEDPAIELSDADRAELHATMQAETGRLARLVENVLDLSRLETGAAAPRRELWSADELLGRAAAEVSDPARLRVDVPIDLPALRVDASQIERALVNVLENALKFSVEDVELRAHAQGGTVVVDVLDRGRGVDADPGTLAGLGLGLAIARGFAAANDCTLSLDTRPGGGTRARLVLPAERIPEEVRG
jgi:two-component system, OmpR family, sensor histidine kinase KdpD